MDRLQLAVGGGLTLKFYNKIKKCILTGVGKEGIIMAQSGNKW
jgi:hypothetical protein